MKQRIWWVGSTDTAAHNDSLYLPSHYAQCGNHYVTTPVTELHHQNGYHWRRLSLRFILDYSCSDMEDHSGFMSTPSQVWTLAPLVIPRIQTPQVR